MASNETQLNLGALRSAIQLTLHTFHAARLWNGRAPTQAQFGIIGLNGYLSITNKMMRGAAQDDPYSDWWMLRVEDKINDAKTSLQHINEQVDQVFEGVPPTLSLGENLNLQPASLAVFAGSPLGFLAIYLLADYDELARRILLAHHVALIDRVTLDRWLNGGAHQLRSLFALVQQYRYSGAKRNDFISNNAVARTALEKFGELPQDVLDGTRRSRFAPPIRRPDATAPALREVAGIESEPQPQSELSQPDEESSSDTTVPAVCADETQADLDVTP